MTSGGLSSNFSIDRVVLETDLDPLDNTVTAIYQVDGFPNQLTREDSHSVDLVHPNTTVTITPDVFETLPGGNVILTITEENTGDWPLENISVVHLPLGLNGYFPTKQKKSRDRNRKMTKI